MQLRAPGWHLGELLPRLLGHVQALTGNVHNVRDAKLSLPRDYC